MRKQGVGQNGCGNSSAVPSPSTTQLRGLRGFAGYLISCCPYTMLGKKILQFLRGETGTHNELHTNRELYLKNQIKIGSGIILIGVFCPIFWFSYLSGARGNDLMFNAVHSLIVILFGFLYFAIYWIQLRNELAQGKPKDNPSQEIS
jgi:hypothetical protein